MTLGLEAKLALGKVALRVARRAILGRGAGLTIIVHDAILDADNIEVAVVTTLPSRAHQRVVTAHALLQMAMIDGAEPQDAADMVNLDMAALRAGRLGAVAPVVTLRRKEPPT